MTEIIDLERMRQGRFSNQPSSTKRNEYDRDRSRIIGASGFRRLQAKSQIFGAGAGDYYRTRLTHSLEVAAIATEQARKIVDESPVRAKGISYQDVLSDNPNPGLVINPMVVECASLAHDMGHPPFGHRGEKDLDANLKQLDEMSPDRPEGYRFEGNAQNFRLLMHIQRRMSDMDGSQSPSESQDGLDLTFAVLLAVNKYPSQLGLEGAKGAAPKTDKGVYPSEWPKLAKIRKDWDIPDGCRTLEAQLMDICDDIAYSSHDIEDGVRAGKIRFDDLNPDTARHDRIVTLISSSIEANLEAEPELTGLFRGGREGIEHEVRAELAELRRMWQACMTPTKEDWRPAVSSLQKRLVRDFTDRIGIVDDPANNWKRVTFVDADRAGAFEESERAVRRMQILKRFAYTTIVSDLRVQRLQHRGQRVVDGLWSALINSGRTHSEHPIIPIDWIARYHQAGGGEGAWRRLVADYIAGMTDPYAEKLYGELNGVGAARSIYEIE